VTSAAQRVLLIGYGNPGRLDDGLGPAVAAAVERMRLDGVTVDSDYQLQVEDAAHIAEHDVVLFCDADASCAPPFRFERVEAKADLSFTTHSVSPQALLAMAKEHFGADARGYLLGIRAEELDGFGEGLSSAAGAHLDAALAFLVPVLRDRSFEDCTTGTGVPVPVDQG
jgi:hydrogenase maturation protease